MTPEHALPTTKDETDIDLEAQIPLPESEEKNVATKFVSTVSTLVKKFSNKLTGYKEQQDHLDTFESSSTTTTIPVTEETEDDEIDRESCVTESKIQKIEYISNKTEGLGAAIAVHSPLHLIYGDTSGVAFDVVLGVSLFMVGKVGQASARFFRSVNAMNVIHEQLERTLANRG